MRMKDSPRPAEPKEGGRRSATGPGRLRARIRDRLALLLNGATGGKRVAARPSEVAPEAARLRTGLMTIRNLAAFVQTHPDMPRVHREKIIQSLIRESEDLKLAAERISGGVSLDCA